MAFVSMAGMEKALPVPLFYLGSRLRNPYTGAWFDLPVREELQHTLNYSG